ncbi:vWA domain-containing protein [Fodinicola feengrottensis]
MTPGDPAAAGQPLPSGGKRAVTDPGEVQKLLRDQASRTSARSELTYRHPDLPAVSPEAGMLDEQALSDLVHTDPEAGLGLLADLTRAADAGLRERARRLATLLAVRPRGTEAERGLGRPALALVTDPYAGADLDLDATLNRLTGLHRPHLDDLVFRGWRRSESAYLLVVDSSGSVAGPRLATAVLTAGALCHRIVDAELAVLAFWSRTVLLRPLGPAAAGTVAQLVDRLADLRGGGTTDLALALRTTLDQARLARAARRDVLLLTDGVRTEGDDPLPVAASAAGLGVRIHVLGLKAPTGEEETGEATCRAIASASGGRYAAVGSPLDAAAAVSAVLA